VGTTTREIAVGALDWQIARSRSCIDLVPLGGPRAAAGCDQIEAMHRFGAHRCGWGQSRDRCRRSWPRIDWVLPTWPRLGRTSWPCIDFAASSRPSGPVADRGHASMRRPRGATGFRSGSEIAELSAMHRCDAPRCGGGRPAFVAMHRLGARGTASRPARRSRRPSRERSPRLAATGAEVFRWRLCTRGAGARTRNRFVGRTRVTRRLVA